MTAPSVQVFSDNMTEVNFQPQQGHSMGPAQPVPQLSMGDTRKDLVFLDLTSDADFAAIQEVPVEPLAMKADRCIMHVCRSTRSSPCCRALTCRV